MRRIFIALLFTCGLVAQTAVFVPVSFAVPRNYRAEKFQFVPLGPHLARQDYAAYMSSIEHLQKTFSGSTRWPNKEITMADAMKDVEGEKARFDARRSFTYSVLSLDGAKELGCLYLAPSDREGYDAVARIWVTQAEFELGLEPILISEAKRWLASDWPFQKVAWPKRELSTEVWNALPKKAAAKP